MKNHLKKDVRDNDNYSVAYDNGKKVWVLVSLYKVQWLIIQPCHNEIIKLAVTATTFWI